MNIKTLVWLSLSIVMTTQLFAQSELIIAHRGASGQLPEHTLPAKAMAYALGADYLEQDVVLTKDNRAIVAHDIHLDEITDVAEQFPKRKRDDGRFYAIDFTLDEIKQLRVSERFDRKTGKRVFPKRFPAGKSRFSISTLEEEIELIQGLNHSTGKRIGIYPEIKAPKFHHQHQKDISRIVIKILDSYGYRTKDDLVYLQCFDAHECRRIRTELKSKLKIVELISADDWDNSKSAERLDEISKYADGIGPPLSLVYHSTDSSPVATDLVGLAHERKLFVHAYTLRSDSLPADFKTFEQLVRFIFRDVGVDGAFTDFTGETRSILRE